MKRTILYLVILIMGQCLHAQNSFYRGAFIFGGDAGINEEMTSQYYLNHIENTSAYLNKSYAASDFNFWGEYGIFNWLGIGLIEQLQTFSDKNDPITNTVPTVGTVQFGGTLNLHFIRVKHIDLLVGYNFGLSDLSYYLNDANQVNVTGRGIWSDIHVSGRYYFKRLGLNINLFMPSSQYSNMQASNNAISEYIVHSWRSVGYGATVGVQYRFF